jgi:hypothetical protein
LRHGDLADSSLVRPALAVWTLSEMDPRPVVASDITGLACGAGLGSSVTCFAAT